MVKLTPYRIDNGHRAKADNYFEVACDVDHVIECYDDNEYRGFVTKTHAFISLTI
jgi:hypothetical protein